MMRITATTDGRYIGQAFEDGENPIRLGSDVTVSVERCVTTEAGKRYISSTYIIDATEEDNHG